MNWLDLRLWLAAALTASLLWGGWERGRGNDARLDLANLRAANAESARHAEKSQREQERTWTERVTEAATNAQTQQNALDPAVSAARSTADRLPDAARTAAGRACPRPSATAASPAKPREDPLDLLAGLLHRHSVELVEVGEYADRIRIAGIACERAYDSLTVRKIAEQAGR